MGFKSTWEMRGTGASKRMIATQKGWETRRKGEARRKGLESKLAKLELPLSVFDDWLSRQASGLSKNSDDEIVSLFVASC